MTLTTAQITTLTSMLPACRTDWDKQGCLTFVSQLATDPRPWPVLIAQAIGQAANAKNLTPKCILSPLPVEATVRTITPTPPRDDDPTCPLCGSQTKRNDGTCHGCWLNNATPRPTSPVAASLRPSCPAPAGLRDTVAKSLNRGART